MELQPSFKIPCSEIDNSYENILYLLAISWKHYQSFLFFFLFCPLGPPLWHMEIPMLGVGLELQPLAYTTATAMRDSSQLCDLRHSSEEHQILHPLSDARD